jgi:hypothetical protein
MLRRTNIVWLILVIAVLVGTGAMLRTAHAQRASVQEVQDKLASGEGEVRKLLTPNGYRQERKNLQGRVDEVYGS